MTELQMCCYLRVMAGYLHLMPVLSSVSRQSVMMQTQTQARPAVGPEKRLNDQRASSSVAQRRLGRAQRALRPLTPLSLDGIPTLRPLLTMLGTPHLRPREIARPLPSSDSAVAVPLHLHLHLHRRSSAMGEPLCGFGRLNLMLHSQQLSSMCSSVLSCDLLCRRMQSFLIQSDVKSVG